MADEREISQRYRELPREEPPRHLDDAILAAARRAAETRPAPLVVPTGRRRWYFPLAAAAVIVLAVAVTVHVERQQPDVELAEAPAQAPAKRESFTPDPKPAPSKERAPGASADSRELRAKRDTEPPADLQKAQKEAQKAPSPPAPPPAASAPAPAQDAVSGTRESARADVGAKPAAPMRQESSVRASSAPSAAPAAAGALGALASSSPEQWLQGIDDLKRQGRHDEAEKQLAEFRKQYPNYRIPEAITEKFEKR